jgi:hypothetical protein
MDKNKKKFWITYILVVLLVDVLLVAFWAYFNVRTREFVSDEQIIFPIREGWIVQIRTGAEEATLEAADDVYFYLQREGSFNPEDVLTAFPTERPVDYMGDAYFYLKGTVKDSEWYVAEADLAEGRLKPSETGGEIQVRTYATRDTVNKAILAKVLTVVMLSAWISLLVGIAKSD